MPVRRNTAEEMPLITLSVQLKIMIISLSTMSSS